VTAQLAGPQVAVTAPLTEGQERLWFLVQLRPQSPDYHMYVVERLTGPLSVAALDHALRAVVARHEPLRTRFPVHAGQPAQEVLPGWSPELERLDVSAAPQPYARAEDLVTERTNAPFDLAAAPPLRVALIRTGPDEHVLCLVLHHLLADAWSIGVLFTELAELYEAHLDDRPAQLPELPVPYTEHARGQRETAGPALDQWVRRLSGLAPLELPLDRPRPAERGTAGAVVEQAVGPHVVRELRALCRSQRCTLFMALVAAYQAVLGWYAGADDVAIGTPVSGRTRSELEPLVGFFLNTLVLRGDLSGEPTFRQLLRRTRAVALEAYQHADVPYERVLAGLRVPRDPARNPLFDAMLVVHAGEPARLRLRGITAEPFEHGLRQARFDLTLEVDDAPDGGLRLRLNHRTDVFDTATVAALGQRFAALLAAVVADPDAPLAEADLLLPGERERLAGWSDGGPIDEPVPAVLGRLLDRWVAQTPDAPAVVHGPASLTYRELDRRANRLAHHLRALGAGLDDRVALALPPGLDQAVAVLAVLRAGAAYLPLDVEQPPARLAWLRADAGARIVVTHAALIGHAGADAATVVALDRDAAAIAARDPAPPVTAVGPGHLAYVIYTSGSTGTPKGVAVEHGPVLRYLAGMRQRLEIVPGSRFGLLQSLSFDFSVTAFHLALLTGGSVHLIPRRSSGPELAAQLDRAAIDYLKLTPSHLASLSGEIEVERLLPRRALILGGEASQAGWSAELARRTGAAVYNHYGPTEATVGVTVHRVRADGSRPAGTTPLGRPLPGARVLVLDRCRRPVPAGVVGELYLGGDRLARGYLGRPELTAERFVPDPGGGGRLYRTGDLARRLPGGELEFLGRADDQIKLRGYRIEPGEIEAALRDRLGIPAAVVVARDEHLVAYAERVPGGADVPIGELRRLLAETLPDHLVPARVVWLDRLPRLAHGKVDRRSLPAPEPLRPAQAASFVAPHGPVAEAIARIWADVLGLDRVGADDDFFDLGGHSLLAVQVVARLRAAPPPGARPVTVLELFQHPTVRGLASIAVRRADPAGRLLHELTGPVDPAARTLTLVCVPYGGAGGVVYQPLARALPAHCSLFAVSVAGRDLGDESAADHRPVREVAADCVAEILDRIDGPLAVYGHCGVGGALAVEIARQLEAAGRPLVAVYLGGIFPFSRPAGPLGRIAKLLQLDWLRNDTVYANWLRSAGADIGGLAEADQRRLVRAMRRDAERAEEYFTDLMHERPAPLAAPIISVVGERDPGTDFYQERYREWGFLTGTTALVVLDEAGHYFLKYRADELAEIVTGTSPATGRRPDAPPHADAPPGPQPGMARFLVVALTQLVSATGTALTEYALPVWSYLGTGSLFQFALFAVVALLPGMLVGPLAGAVVDRSDRRRVLLASSAAAGGLVVLLTGLLWGGGPPNAAVYVLLALVSVALAFQRLAYQSAVPQLVPKHYLGNANGLVQLVSGTATLLVPLVAVGLLTAVGLRGILLLDAVSYAVAIGVLLAVRFPRTMAGWRREGVAAEIRNGFRYFWGRPGLRAMLLFFVATNVFLAAVLIMLSPLVLTVGRLGDAGLVATAAGAGSVAGGLLMTVWGGPRRRRMRGMLWATVAFGGSAAAIGLRPELSLIGFGAAAMYFSGVVQNGIWFTIVHVKVPQRFHGRIIALNFTVAQTVCAVGFLLAPAATAVLERLMRPGGALAGTAGTVLGTGPGRGIGLLYVGCGAVIALVALAAMRHTILARFDEVVPDAEPDDVVGLAALAGARGRSAAVREPLQQVGQTQRGE